MTINVLAMIFVLAPIAIIFVFEPNPTPYINFPPEGVSLIWFREFFSSPMFAGALILSLKVAAYTTVLAVFFGATVALALARGDLRTPRRLPLSFSRL